MADGALVLVVEDDFTTRDLYREFLGKSGFRTADAHNGFQALEKAQRLRPDLILTDLAVPGMDGFELCRALQQDEATKHIPIVAITGHPEYVGEPERFRHAGISHVFMKPCDPDVVVRQLRELLKV